MKKAALSLTLGFMGISAAFFVPVIPLAEAQGSDIIFQQPVDSTIILSSCEDGGGCTPNNTSSASGNLGLQYINGSSSVATIHANVTTSAPSFSLSLSLSAYYDASYTNSVGLTCDFLRTFNSSSVGGRQIIGVYAPSGCDLSSATTSLYWRVIVQAGNFGGGFPTWDLDIYGNGAGIPYFVMAGEVGTLVPEITSSQFDLSGAFTFCNDLFASSTGIGATIMNGLCVVGGYLFIPSYSSIQGFSDLLSVSEDKIPFSYYYDFADILNGSSASSSSNFTALSLDLRGTGVGSTSPWANVLPSSFAYLSSTTITTYVNPTLYDLLFLLMRSAIWIAVLFHIYHRLVPKRATQV